MKSKWFLLVWYFISCHALAGQCKALIDNMEDMGQLKQVLYCLDSAPVNSDSIRGIQTPPFVGEITQEGYKFQLQSCRREYKQVKCTAFITNLNSKIEKPKFSPFGIVGQTTSFFDEYAEEHGATLLKIGNSKLAVEGKSEDLYLLKKFMPKDVPMKVVVSFNNIPANVSQVAALNISFNYRENNGQHANKVVTFTSIGIDNK